VNFQSRLRAALALARQKLIAERSSEGYWTGELSSSALSTATAICALAIVERELSGHASRITHHSLITSGLDWLAQHANTDGGWGDTILSLSNISTTALCWAAFGAVSGADEKYRGVVSQAERWLIQHAGGIEPNILAPAVINRYGKDRTFSAPILTMCALAGRLGAKREAWRWVLPLPFELAACPHQWFAALKLPVVSYALPALIAIGQARHHHLPSRNPFARICRNLTRTRTLRILRNIQPSSGGFLEATPLTSFVVMSLAASGQVRHAATVKGVEFLTSSARSDGSWAIDSNLATWVTTLSVNALLGTFREPTPSPLPGGEPETGASNDAPLRGGAGGGFMVAIHVAESVEASPVSSSMRKPDAFQEKERRAIQDWLLGQQYGEEHPYTHAAPGGWAWTDLPGGVPDADDTAGALLALRNLEASVARARDAAMAGLKWLWELQNRDGGVPTFCRGWGALPFDRSSPDLTAHALRAWLAWIDDVPFEAQARIHEAIRKALKYLERSQRSDGSWLPLWFGNQFAVEDENPTYGTARVIVALQELSERGFLKERAVLDKGVKWLIGAQSADGGWGGFRSGQTSVEETALAVEALGAVLSGRGDQSRTVDAKQLATAASKGAEWLISRIENDAWKQPSPIGFYFAKLWYYERLYPLIFSVGALERLKDRLLEDS
jgi:squalene-hopene/tetraprenyl-beta-curcumene cyclase